MTTTNLLDRKEKSELRRRKDGKIVGESNNVNLKVGKPDKYTNVTVEAMVYGHLAVHRIYDPYNILDTPGEYQITHIPTGYALPGYWPKQAQARALAQVLQDPVEDLDWSFAKVGEMSDKVKRRARQLTTALKAEYGLEDIS